MTTEAAPEPQSAALLEDALAAAATTRPHPNPRVGAIVLDARGTPIANQVHQGPGRAHAEAAALEAAGAAARGGTVVVTLEPCAHHGRTPPCTEAIIAAGVARVVVGAVDPDERVAGRGFDTLRRAGIQVEGPIAQRDVEATDPGYFHHRRTGRALVTVKAALTLDGATAAADGTSQWITSAEARADAHRLRARADAVLVGAGTLLADDPRLTVRLPGHDGSQPLAVVIAGTRPLPPDAAVFAGNSLVYAPAPVAVPAEVVVLPGADGVDLPAVLADLEGRNVLDVLVEGGAMVSGALLECGLVDRGVAYLGAKLAGGTGLGWFAGRLGTLSEVTEVTIEAVRTVGTDLRVDYRIGRSGDASQEGRPRPQRKDEA